jgi:hypothetical protein
VHKGSTQTNKKIKERVQKEKSKETQACPGLAHRTVRCTRPYNSKLFSFGFLGRRYAIIHQIVRCTSGATASQRNGRLQRSPVTLQCADSSRRSQSSRQRRTEQCTVPVRCGTGLSDATRRQSSNGRNCQSHNSWVTWLAHRTLSDGAPDCPVRPSTAACPNG